MISSLPSLTGDVHYTKIWPAGKISESILYRFVGADGTWAIRIATSSDVSPSPSIFSPEYLNQ